MIEKISIVYWANSLGCWYWNYKNSSCTLTFWKYKQKSCTIKSAILVCAQEVIMHYLREEIAPTINTPAYICRHSSEIRYLSQLKGEEKWTTQIEWCGSTCDHRAQYINRNIKPNYGQCVETSKIYQTLTHFYSPISDSSMLCFSLLAVVLDLALVKIVVKLWNFILSFITLPLGLAMIWYHINLVIGLAKK